MREPVSRWMASKDLLLLFWMTAVIELICTSRTDTGVMAILIALPEGINHEMAVTGWADMLDFCVTFRARVVSAVKHVA